MNSRAEVVFFGDSLTYYGFFPSLFPFKTVCNLGLCGDTIQGMTYRIEQVKIFAPEVVFLMAGINDVANSTDYKFKSSFEQLVKSLRSELPEADIIIQSLLPVNNKDFSITCNNTQIIKCNREIERLGRELGLYYPDLYSLYEDGGQLPSTMTKDSIHLTESAYDRWYDVIKAFKQANKII